MCVVAKSIMSQYGPNSDRFDTVMQTLILGGYGGHGHIYIERLYSCISSQLSTAN